MSLRNQKGFGVAGILAIIVVAGLIGGGVRLFVYNANKDDRDAASKASQSAAKPEDKTADDAQYLAVKEWGVRMKKEPYLTNLSYKIGNATTGSSDHIVLLSSIDNTELKGTCLKTSDWTVYRYLPEDQSPQPGDDKKIKDSELMNESVKLGVYKIIKGMYYGRGFPQMACGDKPQTKELGAKIDNSAKNMFESLEGTP